MKHTPAITKELLRRFDLLYSGQASEEQLVECEKLFLENPEISRAYICYTDMEAELRQQTFKLKPDTILVTAKGRASYLPLAALMYLDYFWPVQ